MVEIKAYYGDWKKVCEEQAQRYICSFLQICPCRSEKLIKCIEKDHLRGITVSQLFFGDDDHLKTDDDLREFLIRNQTVCEETEEIK